MKRPLIIGITGSIASGKSEFSKILLDRDYQVYSTDKLGHEVLQLSQVKDSLLTKFGKSILNEDNMIDRYKLGKEVFADKEKLTFLNSISHPQIFNLMNKIITESSASYVFFEVPLLFEAKLEDKFDFIITVTTNQDNQLHRLMQRDNLTKEEALKKISNQLPNKIKEEKADFVIENQGDLKDLELQVKVLLEVLAQVEAKNIQQF